MMLLSCPCCFAGFAAVDGFPSDPIDVNKIYLADSGKNPLGGDAPRCRKCGTVTAPWMFMVDTFEDRPMENALIAHAVQFRHQESLERWPGWYGGFRNWYVWESPTPALLRSIELFDPQFEELRHATMLEF